MEIERKYLIDRLPENIEQYECKHIEQGYLNTDPVVRIRKSNDKYTLTYKGAGLMCREEYNLPLNAEAFAHLKEKIDGILIQKRRYLIPLTDKLTIELDVFEGELAPLQLAEVEFETKEEAEHFVPPAWFGEAIYVIKTVKFPEHVELYGSSDAKNWYYAENTDKQETHKHKVDNADKRNQSYCEYIQMLAGEAIRRDVPAIAIVNIIGLTDEQIHLDIESGHEVVTMDKLADRIRYYESTIDSKRVVYEHSDDLIRKFKEEEVYDNIIPQIRDVELKYRIYLKLSE